MNANQARIFVVAAEAADGDGIADRLTRLGYAACGGARCGEDALARIADAHPDLVLMDTDLAGAMDGAQTAARLRERGDVPVVFLAPSPDDARLRPHTEAGSFGCIAKPFTERELHASIQAALYKHRLERAEREVNLLLERQVHARTAELVASERRFADFARIASEWLWETDREDRFTYFSSDGQHIGFDFATFFGRRWSEVAAHDPGELPRIAALDDAMRRRSPFRDLHCRILVGVGSMRWCAISGEPRFDDAGAFLGYRGAGRDVTELVETQAAMESRNRVLDAMLMAMPDGVRVVDDKVTLYIQNDRLFEIFDLDKQACMTAPDPVYYPLLEMARRGEYGPGDPEVLVRERQEAVRRRLATVQSFGYERQLKTGRWVEARIAAIEGGGWVSLYRDTTEARQREQALARQATLMRTILDNMGEGISVVDKDLRLVAWNERFLETTGVDRAVARPGATVRDIVVSLAKAGEFGAVDAEAEADRDVKELWQPKPLLHERTRPDGRTLEIRRNPIPGGGFVTLYVDITERKRAAQELQQQADLLLTAFAGMGEGIAVFDKDLRLAMWNDRAADVTGVDPALMRAGASMRELIVAQARAGEFGPCDDPEVEADRRLPLMHTRQEYERTRPNGRSLIRRTYPLPDGGVMLIYIDITARKESERALRELNATLEQRVGERTQALAASERQLARAQRIAKLGHWVWTGPPYASWADGRVQYSAAAAAVFGVAPEELAIADDAYIERFVHPDDRARVRAGFANYIERRKLGTPLDYRILRPDGGMRDIVEITEAVAGDPDHPTEVIGTVQDVTMLKAAEAQLAAMRLNMADALESIAHAVLLYDRDDRVVLFNHHFVDHYADIKDAIRIGATFEEMFRAAVARGAVVVPEGEDKEAFIVERIARHRRADGRTIVRHLPDGRVLHVSESKARSGGIISIGVDVTEQLRTERQLREAQKMEAIGKLTGGLAHDFNNYLAVIIGNLDLLQEDVANDPRALRQVQTALRGATRAADLTRSLLAFARRQPFAPKVVDAAASVADTVRLLEHTLGGRIAIRFIAAPGVWKTEVDQDQLNSSIVNLANNARDAMPKGGTLTVALSNITLTDVGVGDDLPARPGDYLLIEVSDTGTGMTPEAQASAFEPFFTTKGPGDGTGLGLSMVYGFVTQSGGHIHIYSELGHGTTVRIYLPRAHDQTQAAEAPRPAPAELPGGNETVLVVEDNEAVRQTAMTQLAELGYRVVAAASGDDALALLLRSPQTIDLLFTDVVMPGKLDGYALARAVGDARPGVKILLTSGFPGTALETIGKRAPGLPLLPKPYRKTDLARAVRAAIDT
ncbi:MAG: PAS-domain containing protein [Alphaproteobacteria bacterium]|nr:PAS-domain containing protein [Alphaproteobacteria bacterium]